MEFKRKIPLHGSLNTPASAVTCTTADKQDVRIYVRVQVYSVRNEESCFHSIENRKGTSAIMRNIGSATRYPDSIHV